MRPFVLLPKETELLTVIHSGTHDAVISSFLFLRQNTCSVFRVSHFRGSAPSTGNLACLEWIENLDVQLPEIRFISRGDNQLVNARGGSNHSVFQQPIRFLVHDPAPLPK